jgi:REP element-mobilizing transposase RayT
MGQRYRHDGPGTWHHVMNRGLSRRAAFEDRACVRYFLSCLARVARAGLIEVHAYSVLTTHFHLLVRSPEGQLGEGMRLAENRYVRWFNRRVRRDGPLFRSRYRSSRVGTTSYREQLVRYIDHNPVQAGLSATPDRYPYGSAWHQARPRIPPWLQLDGTQPRFETGGRCTPQDLDDTSELIEARLLAAAQGPDPLDDLLKFAPDRVARWLQRKAEVADGPGRSHPCANARAVLRTIELHATERPEWFLARGRSHVPAWPPLTAGLLRDLAALRWSELAIRMHLTKAKVLRCYETHQQWMSTEQDYQRVAGLVGQQSLPR